MSKKVKFIAHLKINCNYNGDIEFENHEELVEKVTELVTNSIWEVYGKYMGNGCWRSWGWWRGERKCLIIKNI